MGFRWRDNNNLLGNLIDQSHCQTKILWTRVDIEENVDTSTLVIAVKSVSSMIKCSGLIRTPREETLVACGFAIIVGDRGVGPIGDEKKNLGGFKMAYVNDQCIDGRWLGENVRGDRSS